MSTTVKGEIEELAGSQYTVGDVQEFSHHRADDEHGGLPTWAKRDRKARPQVVL